MRIHREGHIIILIAVIMVALIALIMNFYHPQQSQIHYLSYFFMALFLFFMIRFFRDPYRPVISNETIAISPADGKIVEICETGENEFFKDKRLKVSIFMSPNNVHKNWYPICGTVKYFKHHPGKFLVAWHPKSSEYNERTTVVIEKKNSTRLLVRQIAGAVAQRIKCYASENKKVKQGEELGFIKFGSRVDIFFPLGTEIAVRKNQKVRGCKTIIARF